MTTPAGLAASLAAAVVCAGLAFHASPAFSQDGPDVRNAGPRDNLHPSEPLGCVTLEQVSPRSNPVDLFLASRTCVEQGDAVKARNLLLLGAVRARFDTRRVIDRKAWQVITVAQRSIFASLDEDDSGRLTDAMEQLDDPLAMRAMCARMLSLGAPTYFPHYMIDHGTGALAGRTSEAALDPDFDPDEAWSRAVRAYFRCDEVEEGAHSGDP